MSSLQEKMNDAYSAGFTARSNSKSKSSCPFGVRHLNFRCQWLGGWNDADMENY